MGKHKEYNTEPKDGEIARLKRHIHKIEKENAKLKSELRTYEKAFHKNITFLRQRTDDMSLEELIKGAQEELNLQQIKEDKKVRFEDLRAKWQCHKCHEGVLKLIVIPGMEKGRYFRKCNNCDHRTDVQEYHEGVEGVR